MKSSEIYGFSYSYMLEVAIKLLVLIVGHCFSCSAPVYLVPRHMIFFFFKCVSMCVCVPSPCALPCALPCLHAWMLTASEGQPIIPNQATLSGTGGERKLSLELILVIMGHILTLTFFFFPWFYLCLSVFLSFLSCFLSGFYALNWCLNANDNQTQTESTWLPIHAFLIRH